MGSGLLTFLLSCDVLQPTNGVLLMSTFIASCMWKVVKWWVTGNICRHSVKCSYLCTSASSSWKCKQFWKEACGAYSTTLPLYEDFYDTQLIDKYFYATTVLDKYIVHKTGSPKALHPTRAVNGLLPVLDRIIQIWLQFHTSELVHMIRSLPLFTPYFGNTCKVLDRKWWLMSTVTKSLCA